MEAAAHHTALVAAALMLSRYDFDDAGSIMEE